MRGDRDLLGRLASVADALPLWGIVALGVLVAATILFAVVHRRGPLIAMLIASLMFSASSIEAVDSASTVFRWWTMFLLALTSLRAYRTPGAPALMISGFAIWSFALAWRSPNPIWALQIAGLLFILASPMAGAMSDYFSDRRRIYTLIKIIVACAGIYALTSISDLGEFRGGSRYSGATTSAALFALTGGLLVPFCLWSAINLRSTQWRIAGALLAVVLSALLAFAGQRTGAYASAVGCLPLLLRFSRRRPIVVAVIVLLGLAATWAMLQANPAQTTYVSDRYGSFDLSGREVRWQMAWDATSDVVVGNGLGSERKLTFGMHNAYLMAWYTGGLLGLLLVAGALWWLVFQSLRLAITANRLRDSAAAELAYLCLGLGLALAAASFFEHKLISPSNVMVFMLVLASVLCAAVQRHLRGHYRDAAQRHARNSVPQTWSYKP